MSESNDFVNVTSDVIIVLDSSGSMATMGDEPSQAVDTFVEEQKTLTHDPDAQISLYTFNNVVNTEYVDRKLTEVKKFEGYNPKGLTALWDAMGKAITDKLETKRNRNVIMLVVTDGMDNSSYMFTKSKVKNMIDRVEKEFGWNVQMLGANIDTAREATSVGISPFHCKSYNQSKPGDLLGVVRTASDACTYYRKCHYNRVVPQQQNLNL